MPGCWLRKGENEIVVFDMLGPKEVKSEGLKTPVLDKLLNEKRLVHRSEGEKLDLSGEKPVIASSFKPGNGWQEVKFDAPRKGRYVCFEALSGYGADDVSAIAEFYVLDGKGERITREPWTVVYADSEEVGNGNHSADKIFDLQESTYWATESAAGYPHHIVIDLGGEHEIGGIQYLPRMESEVPGAIKDYRIYIKAANFKY